MSERHAKIITSWAHDFMQYRNLQRQPFEQNMNAVHGLLGVTRSGMPTILIFPVFLLLFGRMMDSMRVF